MKIISVNTHPEYEKLITDFFLKYWSSDNSKMVYIDCISNAKNQKDKMSNWYLLLTDDENVVGGAGLISNDFISRMDLYPWLCALYIKEEYRGHNYASLLIEKIKNDALSLGYDALYLSTNHVNYYERFNFKALATGYHPWGSSSTIYKCDININKKDVLEMVKSLIQQKAPITSILANVSYLIKSSFANTSWAGFYLSNDSYTLLYLGPFQGDLACMTIPFNKGVCGKSAYNKKSYLVENVHKFEGHIACSSLSNSEVVVPIIKNDKCVGVIDLDSTLFNNYSEEDVTILESIAEELARLF